MQNLKEEKRVQQITTEIRLVAMEIRKEEMIDTIEVLHTENDRLVAKIVEIVLHCITQELESKSGVEEEQNNPSDNEEEGTPKPRPKRT